MPCYVFAKKRYFKYQYVSWTQPKLTANTTAAEGGSIVVTATSGDTGSSVNYPYQAMDGGKTSGSAYWEVKSVPSWWQIKFPYKLKITGIKYYKADNDSNNTTSVEFYTSSAKTTKIGNTLSTSGNAWASFSVSGIPSSGIITDTVYVNLAASSGGYTSIGEIEITATKQTVIDGTASSYDYIGSPTAYALKSSAKSYFPVRKSNWKQKYANYTLPTMTARSSADGYVETDVANGEYTIDAYNFFFNKEWYFEAEGRTGARYNRFVFYNPLKAGTYTVSFEGNIQSRDTNTGTLSVWYTDGSKESLISYTLTTTRTKFSKTFTTTKLIKKIGIDMTVGTSSNKDDVTHFYNLNIVPSSGTLQAFVGYEQA